MKCSLATFHRFEFFEPFGPLNFNLQACNGPYVGMYIAALDKASRPKSSVQFVPAQVLSERFGDNGELVTAESSARIA